MMAELPKMVHILGGCIVGILVTEKELDKEWLELMKEAQKLGLTIDEIRDFLNMD